MSCLNNSRLLLLLTAVVLLAVSCTTMAETLPGLNVSWKLPLGVGPIAPPPQPGVDIPPAIAYAHDEENIYTADTRGVIFAVRAVDGEVLWSIPGGVNTTLFAIHTVPEFPRNVYYVEYNTAPSFLSYFTICAVRKSDGSFVGKIEQEGYLPQYQTCTGCIPNMIATEHGVVFELLQSIVAADGDLQGVQWKKNLPNQNDSVTDPRMYTHLATNGKVIATILHGPNNGVEGSGGSLQSYDPETGDRICDFANVTDLTYQSQFHFTNDGYLVALQITPTVINNSTWYTNIRQLFNLETCTENKTAMFGGFEGPVLPHVLPRMPGVVGREKTDVVYIGYNVSGDMKQWIVSKVALDLSGTNAWIVDLENDDAGFNVTYGVPPVAGRFYGAFDTLVFYSEGVLTAVNSTNGKKLWAFNGSRIGIAPPTADQQFVFPLDAEGRQLLVPNLEGYTIIDVKTNEVVAHGINPADPTWSKIRDFSDPQTGKPFVVYVDNSGALVSVRHE